jgi:hypothetical protein
MRARIAKEVGMGNPAEETIPARIKVNVLYAIPQPGVNRDAVEAVEAR